MPMYPTAYLVSPFQYPTGNTNLSCPQIHLSSTSPKLVLFASPTLRNSIIKDLTNKQMEMNNALEEINSSVTEAEEGISDLEDRMVELKASKLNIEKKN